MATFNTAYGLCSVIDSRSLLGVSDDEDGCAVITIGKNMVIRCRISDQKQLNSWSTRLSKLTSKVVYNSINGNYVGVFDNVYIKQWTKDDSSIEKLKKHTLKNEIHEIISHKKTSFSKPSLFILFKNGSCIDLESIISTKCEMPDILQADEVIQCSKIITGDGKFIIIVVKFQNKYHLCYSAQLEEDKYTIIIETVTKVKLRRQGATMLGYCILEEDRRSSLLTYWSDGFLFSLPLPLIEVKNNIGKFLGTIHTVSKKSEVTMVPVSYNQIAIYASDVSEEGAFLGIYNVKFGLFQAQTNFKLFNKPPRIWLVENYIVILMGQRLVCVPFTLQAEALSSIACSRALHNNLSSLTQEIAAVIPTVTWEKTEEKNVEKEIVCPENIKDLLSICSSEGWSEFGICQFVLNRLLEAKDYDGLSWCLNEFIDIPEDFIVKLLVSILNATNCDVSTKGEANLMDEDLRSTFLNKILRIPVNDVNLFISLRLYFKFEDCLSLLNHLSTSSGLKHIESDDNILIWIIMLVDAFYQQFVLSRDSRVMEILCTLKCTVENEIDCLDELKKLLPFLIRFNKGKEITRNQCHNKSYSIEKIRLYDG